MLDLKLMFYFFQIGDEKLGKNAKTILRDKETGKKRDLRAEEAKNEEEERRKDEQLKKYQQWGKGYVCVVSFCC